MTRRRNWRRRRRVNSTPTCRKSLVAANALALVELVGD